MRNILKTVIECGIIASIVFITVYKMQVANKKEVYKEFFTARQSKSIQGICAILVMFSHLAVYFGDTYNTLLIFKSVGATAVSGFFLVSGYGLEYSIINKENYLKGFLIKRIIPIAVTYYMLNTMYMYTNDWDLDMIIASLWGNTLWYVPMICVMYCIFYISNKVTKPRWSYIPLTIGTCIVIAVLMIKQSGMWWFISLPAFIVGVVAARFKDDLFDMFKSKWVIKALLLLAVTLEMYVCYTLRGDNYIVDSLTGMFSSSTFSILLLVLSMKYQFDNFWLRNICNMSLEIYGSHALWIAWLCGGFIYKAFPSVVGHTSVQFIGVILGTTAMSIILSFIVGRVRMIINSGIYRYTNKKQDIQAKG